MNTYIEAEGLLQERARVRTAVAELLLHTRRISGPYNARKLAHRLRTDGVIPPRISRRISRRALYLEACDALRASLCSPFAGYQRLRALVLFVAWKLQAYPKHAY